MPRIDEQRPAYKPAPVSHQGHEHNAFYQSPAWRKLRLIHLKTYPICAACEARGLLTDCTKYRRGAIDHIISIRNGGALLHPLNLMTLCASCHALKSKLERDGLLLASYGEDGEKLPTLQGRQKAIESINTNSI